MNRLSKYIKPVMIFSLFVGGLLFTTTYTDAATINEEKLIIINKNTNTLAYINSQNEMYTFSVATGKSKNLTPVGEYRIVNKIIDRPYYKKNIPGGVPENPLGRRWLGLNVYGTPGTTYAIHGNNNESLIGKYVTAGCIRMKNSEIEWLFEEVENNTKVWVVASNQSFEKMAANNFSEIENQVSQR
ncbi:L,D-transpeptidase [Peribacillus huizhouensis]|uniref:Lipoprotein-anchoring transpeptidase ErfK/SrfK n=1 Tax=Peribacillus huizhouensis TaxID=1501239 RepID=A0ABR6CR60_9BACI|nr:L,D-transpeptidase [Peribacillus huizhouensis]MBA9027201.1 lipoprotein-anchoring transpeptidase ErfK/SrfK [Peribacillus huizhouensis]